MAREKYYYCWEKRGERRWLVRARSADDARSILSQHLREEITVERVRCAADSCRAYDACGQQIVELQPEAVADAAEQAVLYYTKPKSAAIYMCRSRTGQFMFCWEHEVEYWRRKGYEIVEF